MGRARRADAFSPTLSQSNTNPTTYTLQQENRPYVGLLRVPSGGFTLVEAFLDAKTVKVRVL